MNFNGFIKAARGWLRMERPAERRPLGPSRVPGASSPNDAFTPTRPQSGRRSLVGRHVELARIVDGLLDDQAHVVLYSERGRGKTSLSNLAVETLRQRGVTVARYACEASTDFDSLIRGLLCDLPASLMVERPAEKGFEGCEAILPYRSLSSQDVARIPDRLTCPILVFAIDEFDRVTDSQTRTRLADTIKLLSDRAIPLHFMIVGVSATLEQILGEHPSIERNIVAMHLPLLSDDEVARMLAKGAQQAGIAFGDAAVDLVATVARGMPYMAQLLGLRIAQTALRRGAQTVAVADLKTAVQRLLDETGSTVLSIHAALSEGPLGAEAQAALRLVANADQDCWGRMSVVHTGSYVMVGGARISPGAWSLLLASGVVVQPYGEAGVAQIEDRPLIYYVQLLAARERLLAGEESKVFFFEKKNQKTFAS